MVMNIIIIIAHWRGYHKYMYVTCFMFISGSGGVGDILVGSSSLLKEKEQAQKRRELEAKQPWSQQTTAPRPLFGPPIQVCVYTCI
jgi:hypothetical protein